MFFLSIYTIFLHFSTFVAENPVKLNTVDIAVDVMLFGYRNISVAFVVPPISKVRCTLYLKH